MMKIRQANLDDIHDLLTWRNDSLTRQMALETDKVTMDEHTTWLKNTLNNDKRLLYIAEEENNKIGVVRFDKLKQGILVSINLNPTFRGCGLASDVLKISERKMRGEWADPPLLAEIKEENLASLKIFKKSGFKKSKSIATNEDGVMTFEKVEL